MATLSTYGNTYPSPTYCNLLCRFVIAAGTMPSHCTLMDSAGTAVYQYGAAHRNTISWSPHGRFLCIAGFGNLAGEMDFYDTLRSKKIG